VTELLFRPPALFVTLEALALVLLVLWQSMIRFGPLQPAPQPARRSKEEFLDAMAELLERNGNRAEAYRTVRNAVLRKLETALAIPAGTPIEDTMQEAARRFRIDPEPLQRLLEANGPPGNDAHAFLQAITQLESAAHECFAPRPR
jgi:hypothetical protein